MYDNFTVNKQKLKYQYRTNEFLFSEDKKSDEIFIGKSYDKNISYITHDKKSRSKGNIFSEKHTAVNFDRLKDFILSKFIYGTLYFFVLLIFVFLLDDFNSNSLKLIHLNIAALISVGLYFLIFSIGISFFIGKRKIKLMVRGDFLHLKSFPGFHQTIPLNTVKHCLIYTNRVETFFNPNYFETNPDGSSVKINLESGISIVFKNGKQVMIGSSNNSLFKNIAAIK